MGIEISEMGIKLRRFGIFMLRKSYRSVCNHPFLVCTLLFLVFLYRSSPFLFSLLVSASPVLVCTAVLLGTLLSFGQPNIIPEIEKDEKFVNEIGSLRTGVRTETVVVEKSEGSSVERVTHKNLEITEQLNDDVNLVADTSRELGRGDSLDSNSLLIGEGSRDREINLDKEEDERKNEMHVDRKSKADEDDELEMEMDKSPAESFDSERVNVDSLDSPPSSPWKHAEEEAEDQERVRGAEVDEAEEEDDDESDQAESSSPDASMADIIPMLDELHPLLDDDAPQPIPLSHDGSDAASERSDESGDSGGSVSEDNIEKHEDLEDGVDDEENEDADDEDEELYNKESQTKAGITWTEEDQRNLMDLGSSELERNQRLESLIARRRAKKCMSMMPERNLIDFESTDLPFNIAPISTSRNNPFDIGHDSYGNNMGLPPIPGSAPSILLPRRNPFDIPYDSSEEKPNLTGDSFQQEFSSSQQKETLFRRRESFNVGPSIFGPNRQDRHESRFRPFFVPERSYSEESSYSPFQRQSSGLSDSKASSVPETESVVSTGDIEENNNLVLEDNVITQDAGPVNFVPEIELRSQSGDLETQNSLGEDICEALEEPLMTVEHSNHGDEDLDFTQETEVIVKMEDVSEHVGHGSQSSEEDEDSSSSSENDEDLVENDNHKVEHLRISNPVELHDRDANGMPTIVEGRDYNEGTDTPVQHSLHGSDTNKVSVSVSDTHHKEPIYDSSPTSLSKNASSSSILSEINAESDIMGFPSALIKAPVSIAEMESESEGRKPEGTADTNEKRTEIDTSKIDLPLGDVGDEGSDSRIITDVAGSQSPVGTSVDANVNGVLHPNVESLATSESTDAVNSLESDEKQIYSNGQHSTEEKSFPDFGEELIFLDRTTDEEHGVQQEPLVMQEEMSEDSSPRESLNVSDVQELETVPANINFPTSPESMNISSEAYESRAVECYSDYEFENDSRSHAEDLAEEIGEEFLSELDTVGDFSVKNLDSGLHVFETHVASREEADISALHMLGSSSTNHDHASNGSEVHSSDHLEFPEKTILPKENETDSVESKAVENSNLEDVDFEMPVVEAQSLEDIKAVFKKAETSTNGEIVVDNSEELHEGQDSRKSATFEEMPMIEARSEEDIEAIFKKTESTHGNALDDSCKLHEGEKPSLDVSPEKALTEEAQSTSDVQKNELNKSDMIHEDQTIETTSSKTPVDSKVLVEAKGANVVQESDMSSKIDLDKNEAGAVNDEKSNENESVAQGTSTNSADVKSDAEVDAVLPETCVLSRDEGNREESVLTFKNDLEKNEGGNSNDQELSMKQPVLQENRFTADVNSDANIAVKESSVVSNEKKNEKDSKKSNSSSSSSSSSDSSSSDSDNESK